MSTPTRVVPTWSVAGDLAAVVGLMGLALLGLDDSYATRAYLVVGMIGVIAVSAWCLLCLVQGWGAAVYLLVASLAYPLVGASSALHSLDYLGLPSIQAVLDTLTATITAPAEFLTTIPPVDAEGTVLLIPHLIGYIFGGAAAWLALRTTRPMLPVLPLVASMVLCIGLGTETPTALVVRAALFAGTVLVWVVVRSGRLRQLDHSARGRTARGLGAAVATFAAVGVAAALLPPVPSDARAVLRGRVGTGQDVSQLDNPLSGFRRNTPQPTGASDNVANRRLLLVKGLPPGMLMRYVALDLYDGNTWTAGNRTVADDLGSMFQRIGEQVGARRPGRPIKVSVEVKRPWTSSWLPLAGALTGITFDYLDGRAQREDVRYNLATLTGMVVGGLGYRDDYTFTAVVPTSHLSRSMRAYGNGEPLLPAGAFLDQYLAPWRKSGLTEMQQVFSLARYLRINGRYSDGGTLAERRYLPGHNQARLGRLFFGAPSIVGDDEQYAAFMALAANRLGVPARVLVGARPTAKGWVRGRNVLAWVEVRVADGTWRRLPQEKFMGHKPPKRSDVRQPVASYVQRTRPPTPPQQTPTTPNQSPTQHKPESEPASGLTPVSWLPPLVLLLVAWVPLVKWCRRRLRQRASRTSRRVVGGWEELLDLARDQSRQVPEGLPRTEQARQLGLAAVLARRADDLVFAREEPSAEQAAEFWVAAGEERRRQSAAASRPRRVAALWNVRSLVHGWSQWRRRRPRRARLVLRRAGR